MPNQALQLLTPVTLGACVLRNRVVMAPMTRMRSGPRNVPRALNVEYYVQRASAGLIVTEGTPVSPFGHGYVDTPGIHTEEQAAGWGEVVRAVHTAGGTIYLQLWHVGRMSHSDLLPDHAMPVGPSALSAGDQAFTHTGPKPHPVARSLETGEVKAIAQEFRQGAELAKVAGFDGVEIHAANGYLLEQFLASGSNLRTDEYGGSAENRARLTLEVSNAVVEVWGRKRTGVRLSPSNRFGGIEDSNRWQTWSTAVRCLAELDLAYIHLVEPRVNNNLDVSTPDEALRGFRFRRLLKGNTCLISAGGYDLNTAEEAIKTGEIDLVSFARHYAANPDLVERFALSAPLNVYDRETFYGGNERGYTDYPQLPSEASRMSG